ncbi:MULTISPECIES: HAMP domain-containing sensor histidine kinase [unclassified Microcoleus]|uniref:sensor histidine kinase n=1 Tax=unclassified Microcoleus TaxID=2642155 RepID=UPI001D7C06CC|nr:MULTISPECIES: HAMP domain-containing sensor histidine kinase [unclassified Microcoleus]MCC3432589.1 HAMP domain-containing histidine kinase [Microcoleus sp. PH2017_04_SCI_O_A]MCC3445193.1 HAMP domain-containing histidine kinase [Microcoleus sp. PH2017_03_ELD_O_A]MCC3469305.1 HAMP domain-containing histidine kinase [Microcoleus sp. PH2017_06_SFM_O_A]MCC3502734.1 HAMP domain-containing histidine kinase [Microcoleus sp. PH2017_19_SFW_U_A]TAE48465.1 MAG: sensor histidine kinase [Oscillatoriales
MFDSLLKIPKILVFQEKYLRGRWSIAILFAIVIALEFTTPSEYLFGYLYTGPILLANSRLSRLGKLQITLLAAALTLLNLFVPYGETIALATVANRAIAVMALGVTGYLSDRTQQYQEAIAIAKAQLQSQQQLASIREDFVSTLSHDLKTPMLGAIETIKAFQGANFGEVTTSQQKVLETMARSQKMSLQLVETLLDVYRNDAEGLKLQLAPVNLAALAEEVIATLIHLSAARRVYISISYGESDFRRSLWVNGDEVQLQRVFVNLLTNAINHSPRGGKVEIVMESYATDQVVKVIDSGLGITSDELPQLFERFYQGNGDRQAKGSGLGLYLSRQIIDAHGGIIWAENKLPLGALFGFRLPAISANET